MELPYEVLNMTMQGQKYEHTFYVGRIGFNPHFTAAETVRIATSLFLSLDSLKSIHGLLKS